MSERFVVEVKIADTGELVERKAFTHALSANRRYQSVLEEIEMLGVVGTVAVKMYDTKGVLDMYGFPQVPVTK